MKKKDSQKSEESKYIVDSTIIIQLLPDIWPFKKNDKIILPGKIWHEIKSFRARSALELLLEEHKIKIVSPSEVSFKKIEEMALQTGDYDALSHHDLTILSLALDHPNFTILSDDNAIQNICYSYNIPVKSFFSKISNKRKYYWKCSVCSNISNSKVTSCTECGSPVYRRYKRIKID